MAKESNFDKLAQKLAGQKGVSDPRALAATIGRQKYGGKVMGQAAQRGVSASSQRRLNQSEGQGAAPGGPGY